MITERPRPEIIKKRLLIKAIVLISILAVAMIGAALVQHYFYILDSYLYTAEFHYLFIMHNLKDHNIDLFTEYFRPMDIKTRAFPMVLAAHMLQQFCLPFSGQILVAAAVRAFGAVPGGLLSYISFILLGFISAGIGKFLFGDIQSLVELRRYPDRHISLSGTGVSAGLISLFAVPVVPISFTGIFSGFLNIPFKRVFLCMTIGFCIRLIMSVTFFLWNLPQ
ncbi:MAG TPA: hypothetical protein VK452_04870 [Dissulfurispiraceae bacterium]|nr:hypothetical protein [Dissulfurispiraceae bacterium]